jgi:putative SOS response-associated peptidase YedK
MCGRFAQFSPVALFKEALDIRAIKCDPVQSYNVAPAQDVLAVVHYDERLLTKFFWGISPRIYKDSAKPPLLINARFETIAEKPSFREAYRFRRCLVPTDGFYEWEKAGSKKQPWFFKVQSNLPFAFAGIWEKRREKDESIRNTFAIITTEAVVPVSKIHDRMPVILNRNAYESWLNPSENDPKKVKEIIKEGVIKDISGYPVSRSVNSVSNNDPSCIEPVNSELQQKQLI